MHSQLLARLKSESKYKTTEGGAVGACSLTHNTLRGRGACWSFGMGLGRVNKFHSLTRPACIAMQSSNFYHNDNNQYLSIYYCAYEVNLTTYCQIIS